VCVPTAPKPGYAQGCDHAGLQQRHKHREQLCNLQRGVPHVPNCGFAVQSQTTTTSHPGSFLCGDSGTCFMYLLCLGCCTYIETCILTETTQLHPALPLVSFATTLFSFPCSLASQLHPAVH
jgi:hypothetical protein